MANFGSPSYLMRVLSAYEGAANYSLGKSSRAQRYGPMDLVNAHRAGLKEATKEVRAVLQNIQIEKKSAIREAFRSVRKDGGFMVDVIELDDQGIRNKWTPWDYCFPTCKQIASTAINDNRLRYIVSDPEFRVFCLGRDSDRVRKIRPFDKIPEEEWYKYAMFEKTEPAFDGTAGKEEHIEVASVYPEDISKLMKTPAGILPIKLSLVDGYWTEAVGEINNSVGEKFMIGDWSDQKDVGAPETDTVVRVQIEKAEEDQDPLVSIFRAYLNERDRIDPFGDPPIILWKTERKPC